MAAGTYREDWPPGSANGRATLRGEDFISPIVRSFPFQETVVRDCISMSATLQMIRYISRLFLSSFLPSPPLLFVLLFL